MPETDEATPGSLTQSDGFIHKEVQPSVRTTHAVSQWPDTSQWQMILAATPSI